MRIATLIDKTRKNCEGYLIIESLVGITIIGIISALLFMITIPIFSNPKLMLRDEAILAANKEINLCQISKSLQDTTYLCFNNLLKVERKISPLDMNNEIEIVVMHTKSEKELIKYSLVCLK